MNKNIYMYIYIYIIYFYYRLHIHMHIQCHIQIHVPYMGPGRAAGSAADGRAGAHVRYMYLYMYMHMYTNMYRHYDIVYANVCVSMLLCDSSGPFGELVPGKTNMGILELRFNGPFFSKKAPQAKPLCSRDPYQNSE